jgi:hypothetical protein
VLDGARNVKLFDEENKEVSFAEEFIIPLSVVSWGKGCKVDMRGDAAEDIVTSEVNRPYEDLMLARKSGIDPSNHVISKNEELGAVLICTWGEILRGPGQVLRPV